ncbi:CPBP family intramembrane metalloprotease [Flavobacteriaceae bacterium]|nr:CPBP family intramembrane metalloprotease [Flavobacteriaceae bacterium]MDC1491945.1 CPBP family intramembrane metalloprotease [Flavobacteriaceae bacterium]
MYIEQVQKNSSSGWLYLIGFLIICFVWQFIGAIPWLSAIIYKNGLDGFLTAAEDQNKLMSALGNSNLTLFFILLTFAIGLAGLFFTVKFIHSQSLTSLTTSRSKIDWNRIWFSFTLWGVLSVIMTLISIYFAPEDYVFNFELNSFLILAVIAICLVPIQTSFEEYFFRGYLMQGIGNVFKNRWVPLIFTSVVFGLLHIVNPEVSKLGYFIMIYYIGTGFFLGILTLMDEGMELALGFHAANNLFIALLVTAEWTAFKTDSIFKYTAEPTYIGWTEFLENPWIITEIALPVFIIFPILLFVFSKKYNWSNWSDKLTGPVKVITRSEEDVWDKR